MELLQPELEALPPLVEGVEEVVDGVQLEAVEQGDGEPRHDGGGGVREGGGVVLGGGEEAGELCIPEVLEEGAIAPAPALLDGQQPPPLGVHQLLHSPLLPHHPLPVPGPWLHTLGVSTWVPGS